MRLKSIFGGINRKEEREIARLEGEEVLLLPSILCLPTRRRKRVLDLPERSVRLLLPKKEKGGNMEKNNIRKKKKGGPA